MKSRITWPLVAIAAVTLALSSCLFPALGVRTTGSGRLAPADIHAIDFDPASGTDSPWNSWSASFADTAFTRARMLGANTVRLTIDTTAFALPTPSTSSLDTLGSAIALASNDGLHVELVLFHGLANAMDATSSSAWIAAVLARFASDPRVAAISLRPDFDPSASAAQAWSIAMIDAVHTASPGTPVGLTIPETADSSAVTTLGATLTGGHAPDWLGVTYRRLSHAMYARLWPLHIAAGSLPLRIEDTGFSTATDYQIDGHSYAELPAATDTREAFQDLYLRTVAYAAQQLGSTLSIVPQTLVDGSSAGFGLFRNDWSAKPAAATMSTIFSGSVDTSFNGNFAVPTASSGPAGWLQSEQQTGMFFGVDMAGSSTECDSGDACARISQPPMNDWASLIGLPPLGAVVIPGHTYSVTASVRSLNSTSMSQSRIGLGFISADGSLIGWSDSNLSDMSSGVTTWQTLSASASTFPTGTAYVTVYLKAVNNMSGGVWFRDVVFH